MRKRSWLSRNKARLFSTVVLLAVCFVILFPLVWGLVTSFRDGLDLQGHPSDFFPSKGEAWTFENYIEIFTSEEYPVGNWILNSFLVSTLTTVFYLTIISFAAYAFVFFRFRFRNALFYFLLATMTVPGIVLTAPQFTNIVAMDLNKTIWGLILPGLCGVYGLFLVRQFFLGIPMDLVENARIDGASNFTIFRKVVLPLGKSALLVEGLFSFLGSWNDLQWAQLVLGRADPKQWTLTIGLAKVIEGNQTFSNVGIQLACAIISMVPVLILFLIVQDRIVEGVAMTGIKR